MRPILPGQRSAAVEDVQRRLHVLGYDLGPTGVDGVFLGKTRDAVAAFQRECGLSEDGIVGAETWAALVDATFVLGDRTLYLRLPHFHGRDVRTVQEAIGALGFPVGVIDGIFGPTTASAVREFQRNSGLETDGIVGAETVRVLERLRHVWEGRSSRARPRVPCAGAEIAGSRFVRSWIAFGGRDSAGAEIAGRVVNLAAANDPRSRVVLAEGAGSVDLLVSVTVDASRHSSAGEPVITWTDDIGSLATRLAAGLAAGGGARLSVTVDIGCAPADDDGMQRISVRLLDAVSEAYRLLGQ